MLLAPITTLLLLSLRSDLTASQDVPDIFADAGPKVDWFAIKSQQTITARPSHHKTTTWQVEEYFSLKTGTSCSFHDNSDTGETYYQLSYEGRLYYLLFEADDKSQPICRLDNRHDHSTLFPWRYKLSSNQTKKTSYVLGLGAIWLNLIEQKATCRVKQINQLVCSFENESKTTSFEYGFDLVPVGGRSMKATTPATPKRVKVVRRHTIHLDQSSLLQQVDTDAQISSLDIIKEADLGDQVNIGQRIRELVKLCRQSVKTTDAVFPSLMRQVASSERRNYFFSYSVKLYDDGGAANGNQKPRQQWNIGESFSYELETQTFLRSSLGVQNKSQEQSDKYLRIFNIMPGKSVNYHVEYDGQQVDRCTFGAYDDIIKATTRLGSRKLSLAHHQDSGELVGLGALLMNVADIQHKRELAPTGSRVLLSDKWFSYVEWVVQDFEQTGQRIHVFFRKSNFEDNANERLQMGDLLRVQVRKLISSSFDGHPDDDGDSGQLKPYEGLNLEEQLMEDYLYPVVLEVEVAQYSEHLYQDEIDETFRVPPMCPQATDCEAQEDATKFDEDPVVLPTQDDQDDPQSQDELELEFPTFEEALGFARDYKISSTWSLDNGTSIRLTELLLYGSHMGDPGHLLVGLEAQIRADEQPEHRLRFFIRYMNSLILRVEENATCRQVNRADSWLESLSTTLTYGLVEDKDDIEQQNKPSLPHYGVGALWQRSSQSSQVSFLGTFRGREDRDKYAIWIVTDDEELPNVGLMFNFTLVFPNGKHQLMQKNHPNEGLSLHLESILINTYNLEAFGGVKSITVSDIRLEQINDGFDLALPTVCSLEQEQAFSGQPMPAFPTFSRLFKVAETTQVEQVDFEIFYNLYLTSKTNTLVYQMNEINESGQSLSWLDIWMGKSQQMQIISPKSGVSLLFDPSKRKCKRLASLERMLSLQCHLNNIHLLLGVSTDAQTPGLVVANLWTLFGRLVQQQVDHQQPVVQVSRSHYHDKQGESIRVMEWTLDNHMGRISFEFKHSANNHHELMLNSISLKPSSEHELELRFQVSYVGPPMMKKNYGLPDECRRELVKLTGPSDVNFPSLTKLMEENQKPLAFMRSELTSSSGRLHVVESDRAAFVLLDEYLYLQEAYRLRSINYDRKHELDYLMYLETREFFGVSRPAMCEVEVPSEKANKTDVGLNWISANLFNAKGNSVAFYGALSLWLAAEDLQVTRIPPDEEQAGLEVSGLDLFRLSDEQMSHLSEQSSVWLVQGQPGEPRISYTMHFDHFKEDSGKQQTVTLQRVEIVDYIGDYPAKEKPVVTSVVVNYRFVDDKDTDHNMAAEFLIPVGFGCTRNKLAEQIFEQDASDVIVFQKSVPLEFSYEASLSFSPDASSPLRSSELIHSGWFGRCPDRWNLMTTNNLQVNYQRMHYFNGTMESRRRVVCEDQAGLSQVRLIDELSGSCSIKRTQAKPAEGPQVAELIQLSFGDEMEEPISLGEDLFASFESQKEVANFQRLQTIAGGRQSDLGQPEDFEVVVYEAKMANITLNSHLRGDGFVIKTFSRRPHLRRVDKFIYHDSIKIEVIIPTRAHLILTVQDLQFKECLDVIKESRSTDCYDESEHYLWNWASYGSDRDEHQRRRKYELAFEPENGNFDGLPEMALNQWEKMEKSLYQMMLKAPKEVPVMQLGPIRLKLSPSRLQVVAEFDLMEPTAIMHHFNRLPSVAFKQSQLVSHAKVVSSVYSCSDLCEFQLNHCLAFAYCDPSRLCQTVDSSSFDHMDFQLESMNLTEEQQQSTLKMLRPLMLLDQPCTLYYAPTVAYSRPRHLSDIVGFIESQLTGPRNSNKFSFYLASLENPNTKVELMATELREIRRANLGTNKLDLMDDKSTSCAMIRPNRELSVHELMQAMSRDKDDRLDLTVKVVEAADQAGCLEYCSTMPNKCQLVSYCSQGNVCSVVSNITQWTQYKEILDEFSKPKPKCAIYSQDYILNNYHLFSNTREPSQFALKVDGGPTLLECAAMCSLYNQDKAHEALDCLSFDYCAAGNGLDSRCYLHKLHLIMDDFDETILAEQQSKDTNAQCSHYSKNLLADFKMVAKKKMARHSSISLSGMRLDTCALICRRSETCLAFEFCRPDGYAITSNTCYMRRLDESPEENPEGPASELVELEDSNTCDIYELKANTDEEIKTIDSDGQIQWQSILETIKPSEAHDGKNSSSHNYWLIALLLVASFLVGLASSRFLRNLTTYL